MTALTPQRERREAIRAGLRAPLPRLAAELQRVEADLHSLNNVNYGRGRTRLRIRRSAIRVEVAWRGICAALLPIPVARFRVTWRQLRPTGDAAQANVRRPLRLAMRLLPRSSRDRWTDEWRGELAMLRGLPRLRWKLSTLRAILRLAYLLRRPISRSTA
jgi:hypothetical protein